MKARERYLRNRAAVLAKVKAYRIENLDECKRRDHLHYIQNREAMLCRDKKYREANRAAIRGRAKMRHAQNKEKVNAYAREWRKRNPDRIRAIDKRRYQKTKSDPIKAQKERDRINALHRASRMKVLSGYGSRCACCGESTIEFLSLDHVNGGGTKERRLLGNNWEVYRKAIRENFPPTYQLLCHNCNQAKGAYGVCPHQLNGVTYHKAKDMLPELDDLSS